tara:strand:+ start:21864 stop:22478 length:615 start_codon:yes stop_codon:yes gene_type:complete
MSTFLSTEAFNRALFLQLNASSDAPVALVRIAMLFANWAIFLVPALLAALWLWGSPRNRTGLLAAFLAAEFGLLLNQLAGLMYVHPRPFMVPIGRLLIDHAADNSMPSDHFTFVFAIALGLFVFSRLKIPATLVFAIGLAIAWSRVFLGVHFPLDMIGAAVSGSIGVTLLLPFIRFLENWVMPQMVDPVYRFAFKFPLQKGWIR